MWGSLRLTPIILQVLLVHVLESTKMCEIAPRCIQHTLTHTTFLSNVHAIHKTTPFN